MCVGIGIFDVVFFSVVVVSFSNNPVIFFSQLSRKKKEKLATDGALEASRIESRTRFSRALSTGDLFLCRLGVVFELSSERRRHAREKKNNKELRMFREREMRRRRSICALLDDNGKNRRPLIQRRCFVFLF